MPLLKCIQHRMLMSGTSITRYACEVTTMYVKLFATITKSSIWDEDPQARIVWISMLVMADEDGFVRGTPSAIAREANVPQAATDKALKMLASPDARSGSSENDGRRIERVAGGWNLINYKKYREIRTKNQVLAAARMQRKRDRDKVLPVTNYGDDAHDRIDDGDDDRGRSRSRGIETPSIPEDPKVTEGDPGTAVVEVHQGSPDFLDQTKAKTVKTNRRREILQAKVVMVFGYWTALFGKQRSRLDEKRTRRILNALQGTYRVDDVNEILHALDGSKNDKHLMGLNANSTRVYDGIETLLRDRPMVERLWGLQPANLTALPHPFVLGYPQQHPDSIPEWCDFEADFIPEEYNDGS